MDHVPEAEKGTVALAPVAAFVDVIRDAGFKCHFI
jgi:hypothetical protein